MSSVMEVENEAAVTVAEAALTARLDELDLDSSDERELAHRLQDLERLARSVEHAIVTCVDEADRRGLWAADGHRSVRGWCQATVNWSGAETSHRLRTVALFNRHRRDRRSARCRRRRCRPGSRAGSSPLEPAVR